MPAPSIDACLSVDVNSLVYFSIVLTRDLVGDLRSRRWCER